MSHFAIYTVLTGDYDTIKQPQVYTAYTSVMKQYTNAFLSAAICGAAAGICFIIVYRTVISKNKTVAPTRV